MYYGSCQKIDQHNRFRQASLMMETKINTIHWHRRVNNTLLGMCVVDSYLLAVGCQGGSKYDTAGEFFTQLAEELIENTYEKRSMRKKHERVANNLAFTTGIKIEDVALPACRHLIGCTPTKRRKKAQPLNRAQGRCMTCKEPTSNVCRECQYWQPDPSSTQFWMCNKSGMKCMGDHIIVQHPEKIADASDDEDGAI
jgi:hypothetical protein